MNSNRLIGVMLVAGLAMAGCASGPETVEKDFGNSVRHMVQAQTVNPAAPADASAIDHGDGQRLNNVMDAYRKDIGSAQEVRKDIVVDIGD